MGLGTFVPQGWEGDQDGVPTDQQRDRILAVARVIAARSFPRSTLL
jgi:hypothetical protein